MHLEHERFEEMDGPAGIEQQVCADISARQRLGIAKYGVTVAENPLKLREWLQHAYEECLDMAVYLKRSIAEIEAPKEDRKDQDRRWAMAWFESWDKWNREEPYIKLPWNKSRREVCRLRKLRAQAKSDLAVERFHRK